MASNPIERIATKAALRLAKTIDEGEFPFVKRILDREYISLLREFNEFLQKRSEPIEGPKDIHGRTPVYLTEKELDLFKWFAKHFTVWEKTKELRPGRLILHFNAKNELKGKEFYTREN